MLTVIRYKLASHPHLNSDFGGYDIVGFPGFGYRLFLCLRIEGSSFTSSNSNNDSNSSTSNSNSNSNRNPNGNSHSSNYWQ